MSSSQERGSKLMRGSGVKVIELVVAVRTHAYRCVHAAARHTRPLLAAPASTAVNSKYNIYRHGNWKLQRTNRLNRHCKLCTEAVAAVATMVPALSEREVNAARVTFDPVARHSCRTVHRVSTYTRNAPAGHPSARVTSIKLPVVTIEKRRA